MWRRLGVVVLICLSIVPRAAGHQQPPPPAGHIISGRVVDPLGLKPQDAVLMLGSERGGGFGSSPVALRADGSFVTPPLNPGTYVLEVIRTPHSRTKAAVVVGFTIVPVATADVSGVTVTIRPDTALTGRFRMESDNPRAEWPPHIVVNAYLAFDGTPLLQAVMAEGAQGGRFVLRNAFGPRLLRSGYTLNGTRWWESRVLLDGVDITNVPTDFSTKEKSQLEVVFTQHPARITGTVIDRAGQPVSSAWVVVFAADRSLWQQWAATTQAVQTVGKGAFWLVARPGRYFVRAFSRDAFTTRVPVLKEFERYTTGASTVDLGDRETKTLTLTLETP